MESGQRYGFERSNNPNSKSIMKFVLLTIASAEEDWSTEAFDLYTKKISHFTQFEIINLKHKKISRNSAVEKIKADSESILANIKDDDFVILMDEKGKSFDSIQLSKKIENILLGGYATDICVKESVAGYIDLVDDFNVFIVGDATMATFPARSRPSEPTRDELIRASLYVPITQISWIKKMNN